MGLFTIAVFCAYWTFYSHNLSRLPIPEFSGYHCSIRENPPPCIRPWKGSMIRRVNRKISVFVKTCKIQIKTNRELQIHGNRNMAAIKRNKYSRLVRKLFLKNKTNIKKLIFPKKNSNSIIPILLQSDDAIMNFF